jgi:hypothetical protein
MKASFAFVRFAHPLPEGLFPLIVSAKVMIASQNGQKIKKPSSRSR